MKEIPVVEYRMFISGGYNVTISADHLNKMVDLTIYRFVGEGESGDCVARLTVSEANELSKLLKDFCEKQLNQ